MQCQKYLRNKIFRKTKVIKRIIAILLLGFFTLISFQQLTVMAFYVLNQDFITENFCINKDKPEMQCKGKCHMKDALAKATNQEKNSEALNLGIQVQFPVFISKSSGFVVSLNNIYNAKANFCLGICLLYQFECFSVRCMLMYFYEQFRRTTITKQ